MKPPIARFSKSQGNLNLRKLGDCHYSKALTTSCFFYAWTFERGQLVALHEGYAFTSEESLLTWGQKEGFTRFFLHSSICVRLVEIGILEKR